MVIHSVPIQRLNLFATFKALSLAVRAFRLPRLSNANRPVAFSTLSPVCLYKVMNGSRWGNGTLRGGGIQKIYGGGPSMKAYKKKVDYRLGYCLILCLTTIATVLCIYGLFFLSGYQELTKYVNGTIDYLKDVEALSTTTESMPSTMSALTELDSVQSTEVENDGNETVSTETTTLPTTTTTVDPNMLTIPELNGIYASLNASYITVWNLCALNIIILILLIPFTCYFHQRSPTNKNAKIVYRVALFISLLFLLAQFIFLISPLLVSAFSFPGVVDRLFVTGKPQDPLLLSKLEDSYACNFDFHEVLVQYRLQEPCIPKIKNSLFPAYTVFMLIVIDLLPFAFLAYTYAWDACIKDAGIVREARYRVEVNNQRRPQTREQILTKTLGREIVTTTASAAENQGPQNAQLV
uniref:G_PROTEIN_RECEP_F1_2 domain-containing protein n=1 Tax=Steinernema glaseri TaxID=37863 RepID=A0A1I7YLA9_9BILA